MAYVSQELKAKIATALKPLIPAGWKTTLSVHNHSTIVLTIWSAPVDLLAEIQRKRNARCKSEGREPCSMDGCAQVNEYYLDAQFDESLEVFEKIKGALNIDNWDHSDSQTDYFDVGHYISIEIGRWNKAFQFLPTVKEAA